VLMDINLDVGLNNLIPSSVAGNTLSPSSLEWFEGCLSVNLSGPAMRGAVLIDFGYDEYSLFTVIVSNGYVAPGYMASGYVSQYS